MNVDPITVEILRRKAQEAQEEALLMKLAVERLEQDQDVPHDSMLDVREHARALGQIARRALQLSVEGPVRPMEPIRVHGDAHHSP
jgi:hypothetical protein